jgi:polar amino acid transport system permease protein
MKDFDLMAILLKPEFGAMLLERPAGDAEDRGRLLAAGDVHGDRAAGRAAHAEPRGRARRGGYVSYHRNVPTLVQLMLWYFGIFSLLPDALQGWLSVHNAETILSIVALGLCQAAYFSEDMRSGLRSIAAGQAEAARALGHGYIGSMRHVMLPQAIRNAVPALVNHSVSLFKNSSLAMAIGVAELTHAVKEIESQSFRTFEAYSVATVLYLVCSLLIMALGGWLSRRYRIVGAR